MQLTARAATLDQKAALTLVLAALFWVVAFLWTPISFWTLMALATGILGILSLVMRGPFLLREGFRPKDVLIGVGSAMVLYGVFWVGNWLADAILPFAESQVLDVYELKTHASLLIIGVLMALVIAAGEEMYWLGLVQETATRRWGVRGGWIVSVLAYGGVHIVTGNVMIVVAALVAGVVWSGIYAVERRILPLILSHILWDLMVFVWLPLSG